MFECFISTVNVDDAVDDIVRQFKGVSDGLRRKVGGSPSLINEGPSTSTTLYLPWNADELDKSTTQQSATTSVLSSDTEDGDRNSNLGHDNYDREEVQDNALILKGYPSLVTDYTDESSNLAIDRQRDLSEEARISNGVPTTNSILTRDNMEDPVGVPPEVCVVC